MKVINLTPHTINIVTKDGVEIASFPPSGEVARVGIESKEVGDLLGMGFQLTSSRMGEVENLPPERDEVWLIASQIVATAARKIGRQDVLHPGELVRNEKGQPIGCLSLNRPA